MAENYDDHIARWLSGEINDDELKAITGDQDLIKYRQILLEIDRWTPDNQPLDLKSEDITNTRKVVRFNRWSYISIAATVIITMFLGFWLINNRETSYHAELGTTKEIILPDGESKVILASNAEVSWRKSDWSDKGRNVKLKGKAFFQVNPGSTFTVNIQSGSVQVLGTSFVVDEFSNSLSVECFEGKVRATSINNEQRIVEGGEAFLFYDNQWEEKRILTSNKPAWLTSETRFDNAPLEQVFKSLKDLFEVEIIAGSVNTNRRFSGTIPNNDLELALKLVFTPLQIKYELDDQKVYLTE